MREVVEVAAMIIGLATLGLIITRSGNTAQVLNAAGSSFNNLLATATFQNSLGVGFGGMIN